MADRERNQRKTASGTTTRFDREHHGGPESPIRSDLPVEAELASVGESAEALQLGRQASQLAGHLRTRQSELDSRESALNARIAHLEIELRSARLLAQSREQELEERETALEKKTQAFVHREAAASLYDSLKNIEEFQRERAEKLTETAATLEARQRELTEAGEILRAQQDLLRRRGAAADQVAAERRELLDGEAACLAARIEQFEEKSGKITTQLRNRGQQLHRQESIARRLHCETTEMLREALEQRLTVEQLWLELADRTSPAHRTQTLCQVREKLTALFERERAKLEDQSRTLQDHARRLEERAAQLRQESTDALTRQRRCEAEIAETADRLVQRELELRQQNARLADSLRESEDHCDKLRSRLRGQLTCVDSPSPDG